MKSGTRKEKEPSEAAPPPLAVTAMALVLGVAAVGERLIYVRRTLVYTYDSYYYLGTAQSLLSELSYSFRGFPHTRFLPLYPLLSALGGSVLGVERAARLLPPLCWGALVVVTFLIGSRLISHGAGLAGAALLVLQPVTVKWASLPMSESAFTLALALSLLFAVAAVQDDRPRLFLAAGAVGGMAMLGRYEGALLLPLLGWLCLHGARKTSWPRVRAPALMGLALLVGLPVLWAVRGLMVEAPNQSYVSEFSTNLLSDLGVVRSRLRYFAVDSWANIWFALLAWSGLVLCAWRRPTRLGASVLGGWLVMIVVGHLAWYYVYERFVVPAVPAAALLAGAALVWLGERVAILLARARFGTKAAGAVAWALVLLVLIVMGWNDQRTAANLTNRHILELSDDWGGGVTRDAAVALRAEAEPGDAVATDSGAIVAWYSRLNTYYLPFDEFQTVDQPDLTGTGTALLVDLRARNVRWLLLRVPPGAANPRVALSKLKLDGRAELVHNYLSPSLGPEGRPVQVAVFSLSSS